MYKYEVIPFIARIKEGGSPVKIASQLSETIDRYSAEGWTFYRVEEVNVEISPGCLGALTGSRTSYVKYNLVVFRKEDV